MQNKIHAIVTYLANKVILLDNEFLEICEFALFLQILIFSGPQEQQAISTKEKNILQIEFCIARHIFSPTLWSARKYLVKLLPPTISVYLYVKLKQTSKDNK